MFNKSAGRLRRKRTFFDEMGKLGVGSGSYEGKVWRARCGVKKLVRIGNGVAGVD